MSGGHAHHLSFESIVADAIVFVLFQTADNLEYIKEYFSNRVESEMNILCFT